MSTPDDVILIVEDDPDQREPLVRIFMADFLDEEGFKVFEAVSLRGLSLSFRLAPTCR